LQRDQPSCILYDKYLHAECRGISVRNKYLRIGLPVGLIAVIAGVLLGIFLPGGDEQSGTPSGSEVASSGEADGADGGDADGAAKPGAESASVADADSVSAEGKVGLSAEAEGAADGETAAELADGKDSVADASGGSEDGSAADGSGAGTQAVDRQVASAPAQADGQAPSGDASERTKPSFDVVRIDPKGGTVMAGRAEPGAEVIIRDGEQEVGRATANRRGEWVYTDDKPMAAGDRQLTLQDAAPGGPESEQVVVVSVPKDEPGKEEQALAVLQPREGGPSVILQLPERSTAGKDGAPTTTVDSLDYSAEGEITVSGRAEPGARLNVYVDNEPVGTAVADDQGEWRAELGGKVAEGKHDLRIDSVDQSGKVVARAETEFAKAPSTMLQLAGETLVIVQPGNSLWRIARRTYGGGVHYTEIYQANRDQIGDPDLIYPGQIFSVPPLG
jgi:nucleoid-associated protein YgaU